MRKMAQDAFKRLGIPEGNRAILALDGGGIRGMLTLQLLKALETEAQAPCHQIFDMVSGTSTGGIIAGLIATGHSATEIDGLYEKLVTKVFVQHGPFANQFLNPPLWSKASYRKLLKDLLGNITLSDACTRSELDLLITSHDVAEGEETFFSFLRGRAQNVYGSVLLRAAMEATMSAPTYFSPLERFVDGGVTTHNCPALASIIEAVQYGGEQYTMNQLTVFSFGTGCVTQEIAPEKVPNPPGSDAYFWLKWLMVEGGNDASDLQDDVLRAKRVMGGCDYRRFQLSLDSDTLAKLPDLVLDQAHATDANRLSELKDKELGSVSLDNVAYMPVMRVIGQAAVEYLRQRAVQRNQPLFGTDLVDDGGRDLLVTRVGDTKGIAARLSDPDWLDRQVT